MLFGVVVPGVNLVLPGVFLTEIAHDRPRILRAVRIWWVLIVSNAVLFVFVLFWRQRDALQAMADAVLLTAVVAAMAAVVALGALYVLRLFDGADLWGRPSSIIDSPWRPGRRMRRSPRSCRRVLFRRTSTGLRW